MQFAVFYILLLALTEPLLIHAKKLVLMLPREIRRSPAVPRRYSPVHYKKHGNNDIHYHASNHPYVYRSRKPPPFSSGPPFPHGGDDFDQGHEHVNHVTIPYGKGISHAVTYGKGYIPYENIKNNFPTDQEKYLALLGRKHKEPDYSSGSYTRSEYVVPPSGYRSPQQHAGDSYPRESISNSEYVVNDGPTDENKYYMQRSIGNELGGKAEQQSANSAAVDEKNPAFGGGQFFREEFAGQGQSQEGQRGMEGAIFLPAGIPSTTIGGSKQGVILRDTVALDEYKRIVNEMTKSWPGGSGDFFPPAPAPFDPGLQQYQTLSQFPAGNFQAAAYRNPIATWGAGYAQSKQGYDVKEEVAEPPHDFRTMPVQTASQQNIPNGLSLSGQNFQHAIHG